MDSHKPGDEYALVDEFARVLKLADWFEWQADDDPKIDLDLPSIEEPTTSPQGSTNPQLLKTQQSAIIFHLIATLERFEKLSEEQIRQVGLEIGMRGAEGIDHSNAEKFTR
jgi:hypothetical protein